MCPRSVLRPLGIVLILLTVYLAPRIANIDRMLNTDEVDWLGASANVYTGLARGDLAASYQLPHPGVTTMWAGVVAFVVRVPDYPSLHPEPLANIHGVHRDLRALGVDPLEMLVTARIVKLLFQAALFLVAAWLLGRLVDRWVAVTALGLIAFDPFTVGHDRFLHIDGLTAIASFAAILAIAHALGQRDRQWGWVLAGGLSAIAWLTRFTAGVLAVVAVVALVMPPLVAVVRRRSTAGDAWRAVRLPVVSYLGSAGLTSVALWPAVLVEPLAVFRQMRAYVTNAVVAGHELPIFFNGEVVYGDSGVNFYPEAILWRMTPVVLGGLALLFAGVVVRRRVMLPGNTLRTVLVVTAFAVLYVALMDSGAKKFDRYVLPAFPALALLAAVGWVELARVLRQGGSRMRQGVAIGLVVVVVGVQAAVAWSDRPYGTDYYNPVLGGIERAQDHMLLGWGEGLDQAAAWILAQPDGATASVRTSANDVTLLYFLPESVTVGGDGGFPQGPRGIAAWATTDYYVAYTLQWQRGLDATVLGHLADVPALETVAIDGVPFARLYDLRTIPPPAAMVDQLSCRWVFGPGTTLLTYSDRSVKLHPDDSNRRELALYFQSDAYRPNEVRVRLVPRTDDLEPITATSTLPMAAGDGELTTALFDVTLPRFTTTDHYWIDVTVLDRVTGEPIETRHIGGEESSRDAASANACPGAGAVN